jgi:hypothetical protein
MKRKESKKVLLWFAKTNKMEAKESRYASKLILLCVLPLESRSVTY